MKELIKKWWFWLISLLMLVVIGFVVITVIGFNLINPDKNLTSLAQELQEYDNNITVYQSAGKNTILINCILNDNKAIEMSEDIGNIIGKYTENLSVYEKICINLYTKDGKKMSCIFDIATQQLKDQATETWVLKDSESFIEIENEKEKLEQEKESLDKEISSLKADKEELNDELEKLSGDIIKEKGKAKTYPAGQLTAGTDVPTGKYKIYGGSSNFIVYSSYGNLEVNIILGGRYGINEYIYTFKTGDKIKANSSFKLIAVE